MKTIKPKPNTFYVRKDLTDDIGVMPVYPDAYIGMTTNYDIKSNPDTSLFLAESTTVSPDDYIYGDGKISDIYLDLYVNSLTQTNPQTANWLDVYMLKPNLDITEGNMTIVSGNYTAPVLFYNSYNDSTDWMVEDFDGSDKNFVNSTLYTKPNIARSHLTALWITRGKLQDIYFEGSSPIDADKDDYDWKNPVKQIQEELSQGLEWTVYQVQKLAVDTMESKLPGISYPNDNKNDEYVINKGADGLYGMRNMTSGNPFMIANVQGGGGSAFAKKIETLRKPKSWWMDRGATEPTAMNIYRGSAGSFDQFEETFVARCTQLNSIFSQVQASPDVRDIKDQTLEGPGDTDRFIAYAYANLENSESPTDGQSLRYKVFWENYSGATTGAVAQSVANPFGQDEKWYGDSGSKMPYPQSVTSTIYGIPQPTPIDITTSGTGVPAYAPEIEIVFKINDLPVTTWSTSGNQYDTSGDGHGNWTLDRSFNIIWNDDAHSLGAGSGSTPDLAYASRLWLGARTVTDGWELNYPDVDGAMYSSGSNFSPWISFIRTSSTSESVDVICNANYWRNLFNVMVGGGSLGFALDDITPFKTSVPMGEWVTMRVKLNMYENRSDTSVRLDPVNTYSYNSSGGSSTVYFPGLYDENGKVRSCLLAHGRPWGVNSYPDGVGPLIDDTSLSGTDTAQVYANNSYYPNMTFWAQNMRAINEVGGGDTNHINGWYSKIDKITHDDKNVDILIDQISFKQWGLNVNNGTVCLENGMGQMVRIPSSTFVTPAIKQPPNFNYPSALPAATVAVNPVGSGSLTVDNYYAQPAALTASYMSFGFPEKTTIANGDLHQFLFNDFSVGKEKTALPITLAKAGYFVSGNYNGLFGLNYQDNWFRDLSIGNSAQNIHITGGDNSVDGFVSKGLVGMTIPDDSGYGPWIKSGNPLVGAKIISISDDKMSIVVDKPNVFDIPLNTPLVIEVNNIPYKQLAVGSGSIGYYDSVGTANSTPLVQTKRRNGNKIYLSRPLLNDDAGEATATGYGEAAQYGAYTFDFNEQRNEVGQGSTWATSLSSSAKYYNTNFNLTKATISPYQYWLNMALLNASSSAVWGAAFGDVTQSHTKVQQTRAYTGIVAVSGASDGTYTPGTTYNEDLYTDGVYARKWSLAFNDPINSIVNLNVDYGYGVINSQSEGELPDSDGGVGRVGRDYVELGHNYINLGSYVYIARPEMNTPFNFIIKPTYMASYTSLYNCNINTKDATTNKAQIIYGITDPISICTNFTVSPSVDVSKMVEPQQIATATKSQATDLLFSWSEDAEDINYRILWVDDTHIENKYHKATFIAPLNENSVTANYYTSAGNYINGIKTAFSGTADEAKTNHPDIEGACGYGSYQDGLSGHWLQTEDNVIDLGATDEFTVSVQYKPSGGHRNGTIIAASNSAVSPMHSVLSLRTKSDGTVEFWFNGFESVITSTSIYSMDGIKPLAITVTYDGKLNNNNTKMYINGYLEGTADYTLNFSGTTSSTVAVGARVNGGLPCEGIIDEFTFHNKAAYVPQNKGKYILPTATFPDMSSGVSKKYQSKLFLYDYHNIRGASPNQVCRSNSASWKWTGVT